MKANAKQVPQAAADDRVTELPEIGEVKGTQFAGVASIHAKQDRPKDKDIGLFYWFAGDEDYAKKPTILWSNGGPGSSSLWGFFIENGPYRFEAHKGKGDKQDYRLVDNLRAPAERDAVVLR